jgi:hypothetical protein
VVADLEENLTWHGLALCAAGRLSSRGMAVAV